MLAFACSSLVAVAYAPNVQAHYRNNKKKNEKQKGRSGEQRGEREELIKGLLTKTQCHHRLERVQSHKQSKKINLVREEEI